MLLDESIRCVLLQFSFTNDKNVPGWAAVFSEVESNRNMNEKRTLSEPCVPATMGCSVLELVQDLEANGFQLIDVNGLKRRRTRTSTEDGSPNSFWTIKFEFARGGCPKAAQDFLAEAHNDLIEMCSSALWRFRAFKNEWWLGEQKVEGMFSLSLNCEVRTPLFQGGEERKPVVIWQKDAQGNRVGDAPVPLGPEHRVRIIENEIKLVAA